MSLIGKPIQDGHPTFYNASALKCMVCRDTEVSHSPQDESVVDSLEEGITVLRDGQKGLQVSILLQLVVDPVNKGNLKWLARGGEGRGGRVRWFSELYAPGPSNMDITTKSGPYTQ